MNKIILIIVLIAFNVACIHKTRGISVSDDIPLLRVTDYSGHAKAYSDIVGKKHLVSSDSNELRIWSNTSMLEHQSEGMIATEKSVYYYSDKKSKDLKFIKSKPLKHKEYFNSYLDKLIQYNQQYIGCIQVRDGEGYLFEGVYNNKYFSFSVSNPFSCDEPSAILIRQVIKYIRDMF
jgi:hypothetical protein